jgi:hypothetical protein
MQTANWLPQKFEGLEGADNRTLSLDIASVLSPSVLVLRIADSEETSFSLTATVAASPPSKYSPHLSLINHKSFIVIFGVDETLPHYPRVRRAGTSWYSVH